MSDPNISKYLNGEKGHWKNISTDEEIISAIRNTAYTGHHPCSTAKMGKSGRFRGTCRPIYPISFES